MMDPSYPATKQLLSVCSEIREAYIRTHTMADIVAMNRQIEENRLIRQQLFGGRIRQFSTEEADSGGTGYPATGGVRPGGQP